MLKTVRLAARLAALLSLSLVPPCTGQFAEDEAIALHVIDGEGGGYAWAVSPLGDIDGDGIDDWITSAPGLATDLGGSVGRVYVYSGASAALRYTFDGPAPFSSMGYAIADAGDTDADGVHDILIGAKGNQGGTSAGNAFVYSGATGALLLSFTGDEIAEGIGHALAGVGDINDDGHDDFVVTANNYDGAIGFNTGRAFVVSGADGTVIRVHVGAQERDQMGSGTSGLGDVDGDGVPDYAISAKNAGPDDDGVCFVYSGADGSVIHELHAGTTSSNFGMFFVGGPGDFDADGTPDVYVGDYSDSRAYVFSGADGSVLFDYDSPINEGLGCGRGAGDVNGDGHADLALGAYTYNADNGSGRVYIFSGCDGSILRTITSDRGTGEQLGFDAIGIGDTNGDGVPDILGAAGGGNRMYVIEGIAGKIPDFNGDGEVNTIDVLDFLNAWSGADSSADFNTDGKIDTQDLLEFLNRWNAGC